MSTEAQHALLHSACIVGTHGLHGQDKGGKCLLGVADYMTRLPDLPQGNSVYMLRWQTRTRQYDAWFATSMMACVLQV